MRNKTTKAKPWPTMTRRTFLGTVSSVPLLKLSTAAPVFAASGATREAATKQTRSIHSGHSLTDSYVSTGRPWPGHMIPLAESIGIRRRYHNITKSTIPGASLQFRWEHRVNDLRPGDPTADARHDIADYDTLMLTEGGPPRRVGSPPNPDSMSSSLDYLCRFAANALENGNGGEGARDIILWSIWPSLTMWRPERPTYAESWQEFPDFRAALPEYGKSFRFMADYATWKMHEVYPSLPTDWRVWLFPGHLWMARVWDDIAAGNVPGINNIQDLFVDDIHPNELGGYGLACLVLTCLYQADLRTQRRLFTPPSVSAPLRDYFATISWDIATSYAPVGMNGSEAAASIWDATAMDDPLPDWTPDSRIR